VVDSSTIGVIGAIATVDDVDPASSGADCRSRNRCFEA